MAAERAYRSGVGLLLLRRIVTHDNVTSQGPSGIRTGVQAEDGAGAGPVLEPREGRHILTHWPIKAQRPEAPRAPREGEPALQSRGPGRPRLSRKEEAGGQPRGSLGNPTHVRTPGLCLRHWGGGCSRGSGQPPAGSHWQGQGGTRGPACAPAMPAQSSAHDAHPSGLHCPKHFLQ